MATFEGIMRIRSEFEVEEIVILHNRIRQLISDNIGSNDIISETVDEIIKMFIEVK